MAASPTNEPPLESPPTTRGVSQVLLATRTVAFGMNSAVDIVGPDGTGDTFLLPPGGPVRALVALGS